MKMGENLTFISGGHPYVHREYSVVNRGNPCLSVPIRVTLWRFRVLSLVIPPYLWLLRNSARARNDTDDSRTSRICDGLDTDAVGVHPEYPRIGKIRGSTRMFQTVSNIRGQTRIEPELQGSITDLPWRSTDYSWTTLDQTRIARIGGPWHSGARSGKV